MRGRDCANSFSIWHPIRKPAIAFHISRVEVGDTWAAANFAIVFGDCYYHVLASYEDDAAVSHYGPGALHLRELLAHAIKLGLRRFDFTIGDEPYKDEWSDTSIKLYDLQRGGDLARLAGERRVDGAAPAQALRQANAGDLETGLAPAGHGRRAHASEGTRQAPPARRSRRRALACVMGDMDLLQPIAAAGFPVPW